MAKYTSNRQKNLKIGIVSYTESLSVLEVVGISTFYGNVLPAVTNTYDLGSTAKRWNNIFGNNINVSGIGTIDGVKISSGIVTASNGTGIVTYYGDGSFLTGTVPNYISNIDVNATYYPLLSPVTSGSISTISVSSNSIVFNPGPNYLGIGSILPKTNLDVLGNANISGVITAKTFSGNINSGVGTITNLSNTNINSSGIITASRFVSNVAQGTAPLSVGSSTLVTNLNANYLNGFDSLYYTNASNLSSGTVPANRLSTSNAFSVFGDLNVSGNITIGGTTAFIAVNELKVKDKDLVLGITTDANNNDISSDITANHGGIAIASTTGSYLVPLQKVGINTLPETYKQFMWVSAGTFGVGTTDAWLSNQAIGIGSTLVPTGVRLAVGGVQVTDTAVTATTFNGSLNGNASTATYATLAGVSTSVIGGIASVTQLNVSGITTVGFITATNLYVAGVGTFGAGTTLDVNGNIRLRSGLYDSNNNVGVAGSILISTGAGVSWAPSGGSALSISTSTSSTPQFITFVSSASTTSIGITASNLTFIPSTGYLGIGTTNPTSKLQVIGDGYFTGVVTASSFSGNASSATYASIAGIATYAISSGVSTSVIGGIASVTQLSVSGVSTVGFLTATSIQTPGLTVTGVATLSQIYAGGSTGLNQYVLSSTGTGLSWQPVTAVGGGTLNGIIIQDEGSIVGTAGSITTLNFVGNNINAIAAPLLGVSTITVSDNPSFNTLTVSGVSTFSGITTHTASLFGTTASFTGVVTASSFSGNASSATYATSSGIATYALIAGIATYATSSGISTYASTAGIATYASTAGIATYASTAGIATYATSSGIATYASTAGIATYAISSGIATYATNAGVSTSVIGGIASITQLQVTGVSTFTNGPVLIGSATSTGTASQPLQVSGGAYVSGNVGIGTTNPTQSLHVQGSARVTGAVYDSSNSPGTSGQVLQSTLTGTQWINVSSVSGAFNGLTVKDEGSTVGTAGSVTSLNFVGGNIVATASGAGATITIADNLVGTGLSITGGISTVGFLTASSVYVSGVVTATTFSGNATSATYATNAGIATNVIGGIASVTQLSVSGVSTLGLVTAGNIYSTGIITATQFSTGSSGIGINTDTISGPSIMYIDPSPAGVGTTSGIVRIRGDLYVDGTQFVVNSSTIELADLRVGIATTVGTNLLLDGGGIGIGSANILKTFTYNNASDSLKSSENLDIASGKTYKINGTDVLSSNTLGSGVVNSSLTSVGTLGQLNVSGLSTFAGITTHTASLFGTTASFTGVVTASSFSGNATSATYATNAGIATYATSSGIATYASTAGIATYATSSGIATYASTAGIATYATSSGIATYASTAGISTYATSSGIATYASTAGIATYTSNAGVSTSVIGGIGSITQLQVTGVSTFTNGPVLIGSGTSQGTANQTLQVTGGAYVSGSLGIGTTNPQSQLHITGQFQSTQANNTADGGGQIYLNGATGNRIDFNGNGTGSPTTTTRSVGTKIVLSPTLSSYQTDCAIGVDGIDNSNVWFSTPYYVNTFKWYAGTNNVATLDGTGQFTAKTFTAVGNQSSLIYLNGAGVNGCRIDFNTNGSGAPNATTRSYGTKIVYYPQVDSVNVDYATGIESNALWSSIPNSLAQFKWYAGTTNIANLTGDGNLGIGTTNPTQSLHVQGSSRVTGARYDSSNSAGTSGQVLQSTATGTQWINVSSVSGAVNGITIRDEGSTVGTAGSVTSINFVGGNIIATASGIGATITIADNLVGTGLSITGGISTVGFLTASSVYVSGVVTATTFYGSGANLTNVPPSISTVTSSSTYYPTFVSGTSTTGFGITSTNLSFIPSSGNLGLGATTPSFKADIAGDARVQSSGKMRFGGTAGTTNFYIQYNSTTNSLDFVAG